MRAVYTVRMYSIYSGNVMMYIVDSRPCCPPLPLLTDELTQNMTEWEVQKEREEFAKTAALQSQLSKSLSSKFAKEGEGGNSTGSGTGHQTSDVSAVWWSMCSTCVACLCRTLSMATMYSNCRRH